MYVLIRGKNIFFDQLYIYVPLTSEMHQNDILAYVSCSMVRTIHILRKNFVYFFDLSLPPQTLIYLLRRKYLQLCSVNVILLPFYDVK